MKLQGNASDRGAIVLALLLSMVAFFSSCEKDREDQIEISATANVPDVIWTNQRMIPINAVYSSGQGIHSKVSVEWSWLKKPDGAPLPVIVDPKSASTYIDSVTFAGSYTLQLMVKDQGGAMVLKQYGIQVFNDTLANYPVRADAGQDQEFALPKDDVVLNGTGTLALNPEGRRLFFSWSVISKPAGSSGPKIVYSTESYTNAEDLSVPGIYRFQLRVQNEKGGYAYDTVDVRVLPDSMSGKSVVFDPVTWVDLGVSIGAYKGVILEVYDMLFEERGASQLEVRVWNPAVNDWHAPDKYDWEIYRDAWWGSNIIIHNTPAPDLIYYSVVGSKTKVKVSVR